MAYYYVENIESSLIVVQMLQTCKKYFSEPIGVEYEELRRKFEFLDELHYMWIEDGTQGTYSYQSEVYKGICEMFSNNVCRPALYTYEEEINSEMLWEFKQLYPVYKVFITFLNLKDFDDEKLSPYVGGTFIKALIQRLQNSCVEAERIYLNKILLRLFETAVYLRQYILENTIDSLIAINGQIMAIYGSVRELLELFEVLMYHGLVDSSTIMMVLPPLMLRKELCHYAGQLLECFGTAARNVDADLPARVVDYAIENWSTAAADVRSLCRTLALLYSDVCDTGSRSLVRGRVEDRVAGCLLTSASASALTASVGDNTASLVACRAYVDLCGLLIDDQVNGGAGGLDCMTEALAAVYKRHPDDYCAGLAKRYLIRRVIGRDGDRCLVGTPFMR